MRKRDSGYHFYGSRLPSMFRGRGTRNDQLKQFRCQSAPLSTRLSPERHRQHTPRATRTRTRGGGAAFGVMNSPPWTQRTSSTARRSPGSGPRGRYKWMMAAYLCGEILADVCMTSFTFHCCAGLATTALGICCGRISRPGRSVRTVPRSARQGGPALRALRGAVRTLRRRSVDRHDLWLNGSAAEAPNGGALARGQSELHPQFHHSSG